MLVDCISISPRQQGNLLILNIFEALQPISWSWETLVPGKCNQVCAWMCKNNQLSSRLNNPCLYPHTHYYTITVLTRGSAGVYYPLHAANKLHCFICKLINNKQEGLHFCSVQPLSELITHQRPVILLRSLLHLLPFLYIHKQFPFSQQSARTNTG